MRPHRLLTLFYVGPLVAWMAVIFAMSTELGRSANSQSLLIRALNALAPSFLDSLSRYQLGRFDYALRKLGHFSEYAVLAMLAVRAIQFGRPRLRAASFFGALGLSIAFALSDELHQRFVQGRTSSMRDVMIDSAGSAICMAIILAWFLIKGIERALHEGAEAELESTQQAESVTLEAPKAGPHPGRV